MIITEKLIKENIKGATKNPNGLKVGEILIVAKTNNNQGLTEEVVIVHNTKVSNYIQVTESSGRLQSLYYSGPADEFYRCNREILIIILKNAISTKKREIKENLAKYDFLNANKTRNNYISEKIIEAFKEKDEKKVLKEIKTLLDLFETLSTLKYMK